MNGWNPRLFPAARASSNLLPSASADALKGAAVPPGFVRRLLHGGALGLLALLVLHVALTLPDRAGAGAGSLLRFPVELPAIVLALALIPASLWPAFRMLAAGLLGLVVALKAASLAADVALARPFNLLLDMHLAKASFDLLAGTLGRPGAVAVFALAASALIAFGLALFWAIGWLRPDASMRRPAISLAALATVSVIAVHLLSPAGTPAMTTAATSALVERQVTLLRDGLIDRRLFRSALSDDPVADLPIAVRLNRLSGQDVLVLFVESYGRASLDDPRYAPTVRAALDDFERKAKGAGFQSRSAWLTSPIFGGQSWLAHATLLSGLRIGHQRRYESLVASDRQTLVDDFARAGWRTLAVMPAITQPWPESGFYGFDRILEAADLGYRGEPFNWITMPDQFTLAALRRLELDRPDRPPVMATVALISSHAPWTPIPPLLGWSDLGDGSVFTPYARAGDPAPVVWSDPERVRAQYLKSIDYVLRMLASYAAAHGDDDHGTVFIIVGDHQPARIVAGEAGSQDVPIHILARDPAVFAAIADWGWSTGMRPGMASPVWAMEDFRARFVTAFTSSDLKSQGHARLGAGQGD